MSESTELTVSARCPHCSGIVTAYVLKRRDELLPALERGEMIELMHTAAASDHIWKLIGDDRANLENRLREGLI
jgi:hypothetical protein